MMIYARCPKCWWVGQLKNHKGKFICLNCIKKENEK